MADPYVEDYKKSLTAILDKQGKEFDKLKKKFEEGLSAFSGQWVALMDAIDALLKKVPVPPKANEAELAKVPAWLEDSLKSKAAACSYFLSPTAQVKLDVKAKKLLQVAMGFGYNWK